MAAVGFVYVVGAEGCVGVLLVWKEVGVGKMKEICMSHKLAVVVWLLLSVSLCLFSYISRMQSALSCSYWCNFWKGFWSSIGSDREMVIGVYMIFFVVCGVVSIILKSCLYFTIED